MPLLWFHIIQLHFTQSLFPVSVSKTSLSLSSHTHVYMCVFRASKSAVGKMYWYLLECLSLYFALTKRTNKSEITQTMLPVCHRHISAIKHCNIMCWFIKNKKNRTSAESQTFVTTLCTWMVNFKCMCSCDSACVRMFLCAGAGCTMQAEALTAISGSRSRPEEGYWLGSVSLTLVFGRQAIYQPSITGRRPKLGNHQAAWLLVSVLRGIYFAVTRHQRQI